MDKNLLASVDIGSNSFRILIAKLHEDGTLQQIDQLKETVRLAGGLDANNNLTKESQLLALEVLSRFSERLVGFHHDQVRVVATSTLRVAKNAYEFIPIANKILGFDIEVISGVEEARLIYIGAMHSLAYTKDRRLVIDIGGGSTEFIIGSGYDPEIMESVTMGCVSFSKKYFINGEMTEQNFDNAIYAARGKIQTMEHLFVKQKWVASIGTSGTSKSLYDMCIANELADSITLDGMYKLRKILIKNKNSKNFDIPGLKEDRNPVIAGGLAIMIAIFEEFKINEMTIADGSLREGVLYDLIGRTTDKDLRITTVERLQKRVSLDLEQAHRVAKTALMLLRSLVNNNDFDSNYYKLMNWAANLYEIGLAISHNDYHKHGAYILDNADLAGFSKPEQSILADLVRSHRGSVVKACESISERRKLRMRFIIMIISLRLSVILNRNRKDLDSDVIKSIKVISKSGMEMIICSKWLQQNPLTYYSLKEEAEQWEKNNITINIVGR